MILLGSEDYLSHSCKNWLKKWQLWKNACVIWRFYLSFNSRRKFESIDLSAVLKFVCSLSWILRGERLAGYSPAACATSETSKHSNSFLKLMQCSLVKTCQLPLIIVWFEFSTFFFVFVWWLHASYNVAISIKGIAVSSVDFWSCFCKGLFTDEPWRIYSRLYISSFYRV